MLIRVHPENPQERLIRQIAEALVNEDAVIIIPTDSVYALACSIHSNKAVDKLCRIRQIKLEKANFSFICNDLSHISDFTKQIDTPTYKLMKRALPGPYTFILNANSSIPSIFKSKKKTIGIRVPDNIITLAITAELGHPLMVTSLHDDDLIVDYMTDPELIEEKFRNRVDYVIDGGYGDLSPTTVIDCTGETPELIRDGKGSSNILF